MVTKPKVSAVVLAAGCSERMGWPKQLLPVNGTPMLVHVIDAILGAGIDEVVVVLGCAAERIAPVLAGLTVSIVVNEAWPEGLASSVRTGLAAVTPQAEAVVFAPADLPRLTAAAVRAVVQRYAATRRPIVVPVYAGRRGNPVLFARCLFAELGALRGDQGGRALLATHQADVEAVEVSDAGILLDVDTPGDYEALTGTAPGPVQAG